MFPILLILHLILPVDRRELKLNYLNKEGDELKIISFALTYVLLIFLDDRRIFLFQFGLIILLCHPLIYLKHFDPSLKTCLFFISMCLILAGLFIFNFIVYNLFTGLL